MEVYHLLQNPLREIVHRNGRRRLSVACVAHPRASAHLPATVNVKAKARATNRKGYRCFLVTRERQPKAIDRQDAQVNVRVHGNTETAGQSRENVYDEIHDEKTAPKSQVGHTNRISSTLSLQLVYAMKLQCGD